MHRVSFYTCAPLRRLLVGAAAGAALCAAVAVHAANTISGAPPASVVAGSTYTFQPGARDSDGYPIRWFGIVNKPAWATFNTKTGLLTGKPTSAQVGTYSNIRIRGSDGRAWASTAAFSITVKNGVTSSTGSATLSWQLPTENTNGSALTNLAGVRIYYGVSASNLNHMVQVASQSERSYAIGNLTRGTWYFALRSYTNTGTQSALSSVVSKSVQ